MIEPNLLRENSMRGRKEEETIDTVSSTNEEISQVD